MPNFRLTVQYDGTNFCGWQRQREGRTVQGTLALALMEMFGLDAPLFPSGASRTDAGVHARGQACSVQVPVELPARGLMLGLNSHLPKDLAVRHCEEMPASFDARRDSKGKEYRYQVYNEELRSPHHARCSWHIRNPLDVEAMIHTSRVLLGEHDFSSFQASDCSALHPIRRLDTIDIQVHQENGERVVRFRVMGNAFLKHMVRNLVGTLVEVGRGLRHPADTKDILLARDRRRAGVTAPAAGLFLWQVFYDRQSPPEQAE